MVAPQDLVNSQVITTLRNHLGEWLRSRIRIALLLIGLAAVVLYELARAHYRPFIYGRGIDDFHLADTLGNSLGTVATLFVFASVFGRNFAQQLFVLRSAAIAVLLYELLHPLLGKHVDIWDLGATLLAALAAEGLFRWMSPRLSANPKASRPGS